METLDKKYYKISDVAKILNMPESTLRFWETKFTILKPRRNAGMTRFYTSKDIESLRIIRYLLKDKKLKIEAAEEILKNNPTGISRHFEAIERLKNIRYQLNLLLENLNKIH